MQVLITHSRIARTRVLHLSVPKLALATVALALLLMLLSGAIYHFVFLKAAREGWPVVSQIVNLIVRDGFAQRDRFMRENLDAMAQKVGDMQAKLVRLELMSERVSGLAGVRADDLKTLRRVDGGGKGGPYVPAREPSLAQLQHVVDHMGERADWQSDLFSISESLLFQTRLAALRVPGQAPVDGPVGSGFGVRSDPITGRSALHSGLDFPNEPGTPILASASGVVLSSNYQGEYGKAVEIDHGNGLVTRYAHAQKVLVQAGQMVKRGQLIAEVGSTGRSTGPHLHFEVLLQGVPQDPARFLAAALAPSPVPPLAAMVRH